MQPEYGFAVTEQFVPCKIPLIYDPRNVEKVRTEANLGAKV